MSEAKHTPGPWFDWEAGEWLHDPSRLLARFPDARLIAAAPDLLAALEQLICDVRCSGLHRIEQPAIDDARAAIAKAEGRDVDVSELYAALSGARSAVRGG